MLIWTATLETVKILYYVRDPCLTQPWYMLMPLSLGGKMYHEAQGESYSKYLEKSFRMSVLCKF